MALMPTSGAGQVTTDIYDDIESQQSLLGRTSDSFTQFGASLAQSSRQFTRTFNGTKSWRIILYVIGGLIGLWVLWKIVGMFWYA